MSDGWERTEDGQLMWGGFAGSFCGNIASHQRSWTAYTILELESKVRQDFTTTEKFPISHLVFTVG